MQPNVEYGDGCHVWVCVPALGWTEYHPFSVASSSADPRWRHQLLIHSKIYNRWTEVRSVFILITLYLSQHIVANQSQDNAVQARVIQFNMHSPYTVRMLRSRRTMIEAVNDSGFGSSEGSK